MGRLRHQATAQAHAEYQPQRRRVHREARQQVRSLESEQAPLEKSIQSAEEQLRHAGLSGRDLAIALSELAHRNVDFASGLLLQEQQVRQQAHGELVDLSEAEGQAARAALASMQNAQAEHAQDVHQEIAGEQRGLLNAIKKEILEKKLGLGDYANAGGLTPTQQRAAHETHDSAAFYAKQYVSSARGGVKDEKTGKYVIPPHPAHWDNSIWNGLIEKVDSKVSNIHAATRAVNAVRDHYQPNAGGGGIWDALTTLARPVAAAEVPSGLAPIAQFLLGAHH